MTHSKGPWRVKYKPDNDWQIYAADDYSVAGIPSDDKLGRIDEDCANAHLIAASPEMLGLLELLINMYSEGGLHDQLTAVVNKAKGKS